MSTVSSLTTQLLTISVLSLQRQMDHLNLASRTHLLENGEYDFIVVGAGGAGAIVAGRIASRTNASVLLLEAGGPETPLTDIPAMYYEWVGNPDIDWNYPMAPQPQLGQAYTMPAQMSVGKVLGGSTTISGMVYNRGNRRHFDEWDQHYGCIGWNYQKVLPYFLRAEHQTDLSRYHQPYHNVSGPIYVTSDWSQARLIPAFLDYVQTAQQAGYSLIDVNGETQNGVTLFEHTIRHGTKVTSSSAYLSPNRNRTNLHIVTKAYVTEVLFDNFGLQNVATGVRFTKDGQNFTARVRREVILSAGTIGSAQILLLSGIGPEQHLNQMRIRVRSNVPVGENLHDHTNVILYFDVPDQRRSYAGVDLTTENLYNYYVNQRGPLTMFPNVATYIVTDQNDDDPEWPDVMTEMVRSNNHWNNLTTMAMQYDEGQREKWAEYWRPYVGRRLLAFDVQMVRPRARGRLRLNSTNPFIPPIIDPNYFGDERDIRSMIYGIRHVLTKIVNQGPFSRTARFIDEPVPGCENLCQNNQNPYCDDYLRCFIRQTSVAVYRHVGTCRCGSRVDPRAVVDERLRVRGIERLRVIDGSIMPQVINANSWISTAMIGEYGAEMLLEDNQLL